MAVSQFTTTSGGVTWEGVNFDAGVADFNGIADCIILDAARNNSIDAASVGVTTFKCGGADSVSMSSTQVLLITAGMSYAGQGSTVACVAPIAAQQALSGAGAINITTAHTAVTNTGADALSLADGAQVGHRKTIQMIVDPGTDSTLTPTNLVGGTTITFADVGDIAELVFNGTGWVPTRLWNCVDGATSPALA